MRNGKDILKGKRGMTGVMLVFVSAALVAMAAIWLDAGLLTVKRLELSNALDAAALAGGMELPHSVVQAQNQAQVYAQLNGLSASDFTITVSDDKKQINMSGIEQHGLFFARTFGVDNGTVRADTTVRVGPINKINDGIRPFVIEQQPLSYGQELTLKVNATDNYRGNFGAVGLGGTGAAVFKENVLYGYNGSLQVGDVIWTEPGAMSSFITPLRNYLSDDTSTFDNFTSTSKRLWVVPVVDSLQVSGSSPVTIVGFAQFFIEDVGKQSGQAAVTGRFVRYTAAGGTVGDSDVDFGLYGVSIIR